MKLLYITATLPSGAGEAFLIPEVNELQRLGCEVLIVPRSPQKGFVHNDARHLQDRTITLPLICVKILLAAIAEFLLHPIAAARALGVLLRSGGLPTLAKNLAVYPKGLWLARVARHWRADHIHAHWLSTPASMAMIAGTVAGIPWSCTAHRADIALDNLIGEKFTRSKFVRFISHSGLAMAASLAGPPPAGKTPVMHVGVQIPSRDFRPVAADRVATLICPANLYPVKGHEHLIRAMGILRDRGRKCKLIVAGQGTERPALERLASELHLDESVCFLGQLSHDKLLAMLAEAQVGMVVLPSVDLGRNLHEGIPVCLMEAMAHGVPVISTRTGGIPELLRDGAGLLVPPADPPALADAIEELIRNASLREAQVEAARRRIEDEFSVQAVVPALLARITESGAAQSGSGDQVASLSVR